MTGSVRRWQGFPSHSVQWMFACVALVVFTAAGFLPAQVKASLPKYDLQTETKIKGTIDEWKQIAGDAKKGMAELMLKTGNDTVHVYLCPRGFLEEMGVNFAKGDEIQITASKVVRDGADLFLAREIVKGSDTVVLRDNKGAPVWSWQHKN
jgi:hypothetical protein